MLLILKWSGTMRAMRVMSNGIVTIPREVRSAAGIEPGSLVEFVPDGNTIVLRRRVMGLAGLAGLLDLDAKQIDAAIADLRGKPVRRRRGKKR